MIKTIILINMFLSLALVGTGCTDKDSKNDPSVDTSISGNPETVADDPLMDMVNQGKISGYEGNMKLPILPKNQEAVAGNSLNVFPPNVDLDQDNVPDNILPDHPEIPVDNCPGLFNPLQEDTNHDGIGDLCSDE